MFNCKIVTVLDVIALWTYLYIKIKTFHTVEVEQ